MGNFITKHSQNRVVQITITWEEPAVTNYSELITQFWKEIKGI